MIRSRFEHQLHDLNTNLIVMGTLCEDIISKSLVPLEEDDFFLVEEAEEEFDDELTFLELPPLLAALEPPLPMVLPIVSISLTSLW